MILSARTRGWLVAAAAAAGCLLGPAAANATPLSGSSRPVAVSPADNAQVVAGTLPTFVIQRGPGGSNYGGRYDGAGDSYAIAVSRDPTVLANGTIQSEVETGYMRNTVAQLTWEWTPTNMSFLSSWWLKTPGTYYWQPYRSDCYQDSDCRVEGPVRRLEVVAAPVAPPAPPSAPTPPPAPVPPSTPVEPTENPLATAGLTGEAIPLTLGAKRNHHGFAVNVDSLPDGVDRDRFIALVRDSGQRWGNAMTGLTSRRPGRDGRSTVAFGSTPPGALAVTTTRLIAHTQRRCGYRAGAYCRIVVLSRRPTGEADMVIDRNENWQQGPDLPDERQVDLQTVLIHEFGHFSGNYAHAAGSRCQNTPMIRALDDGEYWRSPTDWHLFGCASRLALGPATEGDEGGRLVRRVETEYRCATCTDRRRWTTVTTTGD